MSFVKKFQLFLKTLLDRNAKSDDKFTSYDKLEISDYLKTILNDNYDDGITGSGSSSNEFKTVMSIVQKNDEIDESLELLDILAQNLGLQLFLGKLECVRNYNTELKEYEDECYYYINKLIEPFQENNNKESNWKYMKLTQHQFKTIPALTLKNMESDNNYLDIIKYQSVNNNDKDSIQDLYYSNYTGGDIDEEEEEEEEEDVVVKEEQTYNNNNNTTTNTNKTTTEIKKRFSRPIDVLLIIKKSNIKHVVNSCYTREFEKTLKLLELHLQGIQEALDSGDLEETEIEEYTKETSNLIIDHLKQYPLSKTSISLPEPIEELVKSNTPNYLKRINRAHIERYFYDPIAFLNNMDKLLPILSSSSTTINKYKQLIENTLISLQPSKLDKRYPFPSEIQSTSPSSKVLELQESFIKSVLQHCKTYIELLLPMFSKFPQFISQKIIFSFYKVMIYYDRFSNYKYLRIHHWFVKKVESILDSNLIKNYKQSFLTSTTKITTTKNKKTSSSTSTTTTKPKSLNNLGNVLHYENVRNQKERLEKYKRKRDDKGGYSDKQQQTKLPPKPTPIPTPSQTHKLKVVRRKKLTNEQIKENERKYIQFGCV